MFKSIVLIATLLASFTASASYTLSVKDIKIATKNIKSYYSDATVKYAGKKTLLVTVNGNECVLKNVTFEKYDTTTIDGVKAVNVKMIDEKTYNKLEACFE